MSCYKQLFKSFYHSAGGRHIGIYFSSLISNFPDFTAVCDVAVAIPLYSYIDSYRNLFVIMSSLDSDFEVEENSCFGYQYKPEYTEEELAAAAALMKNQQTMKKMKQLIKTFVPVDIVHFSQNKESACVVNNFNIMMNII